MFIESQFSDLNEAVSFFNEEKSGNEICIVADTWTEAYIVKTKDADIKTGHVVIEESRIVSVLKKFNSSIRFEY